MNIQVAELASRYGMSEKDFQNVLKEHLEALNDDGEHVKFVAKKWSIDDSVLGILDKLLGYVPPEAKSAPSGDEKNEKLVQKLTCENEKLSQRLQSISSSFEKLKRENDDLQNQFLGIQEGREAINSGLVRKYKGLAESAQKDLEQVKNRLDAVISEKNQQSAEAQKRIAELHAELQKCNEIQKAKLETDFHLVEAKKQQEKLFDELNQSKQEYDSLQDRLSNVQFEKDHANKRISLMLLQIKQAINIVQSAQSQLTALLAESDSKVKQEPQSQAKEKSAETFVKPISTEELHQTIEAQKETQKKKKESAFHRVAGFFGFL